MRIKDLRKKCGKTQLEIANYLNIAKSTYCGYELGTSEPTLDTLIKLADNYGVSLDYLVSRDFNNEFGYLSEDEKTMIKALRTMSNEVREKTKTIIIRMLAEC